jgi:hypothetical protein
MALSLSGDFRDTPFSDVVAVLRLQKASGTLTCPAAGAGGKAIYVKNGQIIFATSQDERDRLGEILVRTGKITRAQLMKALEAHRKSAGLKKIGAVFVEQGLVTPKDLFQGLKVQVRGIIHGLLLLAEGPYRFDEALPADVIPLQIDMEELLQEVIAQLRNGL